MKRQITLSIVLTLGVLLSLAFFNPTTKGQQKQAPRVPVADTGIITLSPDQMLRLTVTGDWDGDGNGGGAELSFRRLEYAQVSSDGEARNTALASKTTSDPITLAPGEDVSFDIPNAAFGIRVVVLSNRSDVLVTAQIISRTTGEVQAFSDLDGTSDTFLTQAQVTQQEETAITVVRRVKKAKLSKPAIKTMLSIPQFTSAVAIAGKIIRPLTGNSLWLLSNGGYVLIGGGTDEPQAAERFTKDMGDGWVYFALCACKLSPGPDDPCFFDGNESSTNCKGGDCCGFFDGLIHGDTGEPEWFHR